LGFIAASNTFFDVISVLAIGSVALAAMLAYGKVRGIEW